MKIYRVQYAYAREVGCASVHKDEESAQSEVAYLLGQWLMKNLTFKIREQERWGKRPEFTAAARAVAEQIAGLLAQGAVWQAYDLWQDFYDHFEMVFDVPLFVQIGTVIVDTREIEPLRKKRTIEAGEVPPMVEHAKKPTIVGMREDMEILDIIRRIASQLEASGRKLTEQEFETHYMAAAQATAEIARREVETTGRKFDFGDANVIFEGELKRRIGLEGRRRRGASMGALKVWQIRYEEQEGRRHDSAHIDEEAAKSEVAIRLKTIGDRLWSHVQTIKAVSRGRWAHLLHGLETALNRINNMIAMGQVWEALAVWEREKASFEEFFGTVELTLLAGSLEVRTGER